MLRPLLVCLGLSIVLLLFLPQWTYLLHVIGQAQAWVAMTIAQLLSIKHGGWLISRSLSLVIVPTVVAFIFFAIYALVRRPTPYLLTIFWLAWLVVVTIAGLR